MVGVDIIEVNRVERLKQRKNFYKKVFTSKELEFIYSRNESNETIAGLLATKEAVSKLFKTGIGSKLGFHDIEILHNDSLPYVNTSLLKISQLVKKSFIRDIDISISHDGGFAISTAMATFVKSMENTQLIENMQPMGNSPEHLDKKMTSLLPERLDFANKYDYGKVLIIGGKRGMSGSVTLAAKAAMRSGAGLTYLLVPDSIGEVLANKLIEPIIMTTKSDENGEITRDFNLDFNEFSSIAIGPGLGTGQEAMAMLEDLIKNYSGPLVIDADAINILHERKDLLLIKQNVYITAHEKEFSRVSDYDLDSIKSDRLKYAKKFIEEYGVNLLLKGKDTIVLNRFEVYVNKTGNSGMATAGSGDCLTGIAVSLLARNDSIDMLKLASYIHGLSGDIAKSELGEDSLIASDIIKYLPKAFRYMREGNK